jgi:hypothetical protein
MNKTSALQILFVLAIPFILLTATGCDDTEEAFDNLDSRIQCGNYCDKKTDCESSGSTSESRDVCVSDCRQAIEDDCGNDHQDAANDRIDECVDKSCTEFWTCMVFDLAPECFGFVSP